VKRVVKLVTPAVVHIEARPLRGRDSMRNVQEAGSGTIVEFGSRQYVLTNRHVVYHSAPELIEIHLSNGQTLRPQQIWGDERTDVAIMSIRGTGLPAARIGDSDALEIGDHVLAVGSPFGLSQSVTRGIISAKGRHNLNLGDSDSNRLLQDFLQTDAAINPGNSGGPLVNLRGEVVGLNTAIASASGGNEGIGFSIPINIAARVSRSLVEGKDIPRGHLGVSLDVDFTLAEAQALGLPRPMGTRVTGVKPQSPAEQAELKIDDVIVEFNGVRIEHDDHLIGLVKLAEVGRRLDVVVLRGGKPVRLPVRIGNEGGAD
jgi:serine protease Do